ncbi:MAG: thioredoxin-disulfide reductase [Stutzerimonas stutzeri]|nr:MAG: thioredoxin-disulfide reductase [Stutzerimonas stutzeri]
MHSKVIIIGSGPAGYSAAIYAARAMLEPLVITGIQPGGQLTITTDVENYPGFASAIQGPWLMDQMQAQAQHAGAAVVFDHIARVDLSKRPFTLWGDGAEIYTCDALIIATGAQAKWLGLESEEVYRSGGLSACATCDGPFYRDKAVVVVGGGNTAVEEALYLANIASKVTLVHRRDSLRAERIMQERLYRHPKIDIRWNSEVAEICGSVSPAVVSHVRLRDTVTGSISELPTDGIFVAIGHKPATELFSGQLEMSEDGFLKTDSATARTSRAFVWGAGDVADNKWRQAIYAAGMGCVAALDAERTLAAEAPHGALAA